MEIDTARESLLMLAAFVTATLAAVTGFGGAALLLPVLTLMYGVRDAIPILTIAQRFLIEGTMFVAGVVFIARVGQTLAFKGQEKGNVRAFATLISSSRRLSTASALKQSKHRG